VNPLAKASGFLGEATSVETERYIHHLLESRCLELLFKRCAFISCAAAQDFMVQHNVASMQPTSLKRRGFLGSATVFSVAEQSCLVDYILARDISASTT